MFKKVALLFSFVIALAVVWGGVETSAATQTTVTANLIVKKEDNGVMKVDAHLTNSFVMPTFAVYDNATITKEDDNSYTLSLPIKNDTFALISLGTPSFGVSNIIETRNTGTYGSNTNGRITNLTMKIEKNATGIYFTNNHQYSNYFVSRGDKYFNLTLDVDWSNVQ